MEDDGGGIAGRLSVVIRLSLWEPEQLMERDGKLNACRICICNSCKTMPCVLFLG